MTLEQYLQVQDIINRRGRTPGLPRKLAPEEIADRQQQLADLARRQREHAENLQRQRTLNPPRSL